MVMGAWPVCEGRGLTHSEAELQHVYSTFLLQEVHKAEEEVLLLPDLLQIQLEHLEEKKQMEEEKKQGGGETEMKIRRRRKGREELKKEVVEEKKKQCKDMEKKENWMSRRR